MNFHTSCAIGRSDHERGASVTWIAYATDSHHNKKKYCCVAIRSEDNNGKEIEWYARIITFISFSDIVRGTKVGQYFVDVSTYCILVIISHLKILTERSAAYVAYFQAENTKDTITSCTKMKWESPSRLYFLVELSNILRIVHVVPFYKNLELDPDQFLLNEYLFR